MKVLLINSNRERLPQPAIPLGLCLVASSLSGKTFELKVLDLCFAGDARDAIGKTVADWQPDAIGLSVRNLDNGDYLAPRSYVVDAAALALEIRTISRAPLIIGGPAVNVMPYRDS